MCFVAVRGTREDDEAAVTFAARPHDGPAVLRDDLLHQHIMADQGRTRRCGVLLPQPRAAGDIGQEGMMRIYLHLHVRSMYRCHRVWSSSE